MINLIKLYLGKNTITDVPVVSFAVLKTTDPNFTKYHSNMFKISKREYKASKASK